MAPPPAIKKAIGALKDKASISRPAIKKAIGALKDKANITIAKIAGAVTQSSPELEILVLKSTSHDEEEPALALETHARSIASMTHVSRRRVTVLVAAMSKRLRKTRNPAVALKCLALVHRIAAEGHSSFAEEIRASFRGLDDVAENFKENDDKNSFLRCFAAYLDEKLKQTWLETPVEKLGRLVRTLGLAAALRPRIPAAATTGSVAVVALGRVVEESFAIFSQVSEASRALEKWAGRMGPEEVRKGLEICDGAARTIRKLVWFYGWCRDIGVALPQKLLETDFRKIKPLKIRAKAEGERREEEASQSEGETSVNAATWQAFPADEPTPWDWEVALVESAAALSRATK